MPRWSAPLLDRYALIPEYQRVLGEVADAHSVLAVPLQPAFVQFPEEELYRDDRLHFSQRGHELAARELAPALIALLAEPPG